MHPMTSGADRRHRTSNLINLLRVGPDRLNQVHVDCRPEDHGAEALDALSDLDGRRLPVIEIDGVKRLVPAAEFAVTDRSPRTTVPCRGGLLRARWLA